MNFEGDFVMQSETIIGPECITDLFVLFAVI